MEGSPGFTQPCGLSLLNGCWHRADRGNTCRKVPNGLLSALDADSGQNPAPVLGKGGSDFMENSLIFTLLDMESI